MMMFSVMYDNENENLSENDCENEKEENEYFNAQRMGMRVI